MSIVALLAMYVMCNMQFAALWLFIEFTGCFEVWLPLKLGLMLHRATSDLKRSTTATIVYNREHWWSQPSSSSDKIRTSQLQRLCGQIAKTSSAVQNE